MEARAFAALTALLVALAAPQDARGGWAMHVIDNQPRGADGVRLRDVNADGLPDIAVAFEEGGMVKLYLHPGHAAARKPWPAIVAGNVADPEDAVAIDVDGDGRYEVLSSTERSNQKLYLHREVGGKWRAEAIAASHRPESMVLRLCGYRVFAFLMRLLGLADSCWRGRMPQRWMYALPLEGSSPAAFMAGSKEHNASVTLFVKSDAPGSGWTARPLARVGWVMSLIEFDFDQDGERDLIYSDRRGSDLDGNGKFDDGHDPRHAGSPRRGIFALKKNKDAWVKRTLSEADADVMFMDVGDLDADGIPDIVAATKGGYVLWLRGVGRGAFEARRISVPPDAADLKAVALGDMDGDGQPDLVLSVESARGNAPRVYALLLEKAARSVRGVVDIAGPRGQKFDRVELADLDGDGDLDVVTTEELENLGVVWFENPAKPPRRGAR